MKAAKKKATWKKQLFVAVLALTVAAALFPADAAAAAELVNNPRIAENPSMEAGQKVTWDYFWFGNYPQSEVVTKAMSKNYVSVNSSYFKDEDIIISDKVYNALEQATEWDSNNDITYSGYKYRRIKKSDVIYSVGGKDRYNWSDDTTYHYFRYQPIRWRVLSTDGSTALLLADVVLDMQFYSFSAAEIGVTWKTSIIRSWLNAYGTNENMAGRDYTSSGFMTCAFTPEEASGIESTNLVNAANFDYSTNGGSSTTDKIFLISESDVYNTDQAAAYGFVRSNAVYDEARRCQSSTYAKAMGVLSNEYVGYSGNCNWLLRSPGCNSNYAADVTDLGAVFDFGHSVYSDFIGVRPALTLNLSSTEYTYGGTIASDGTLTEYHESEEPPQEEPPQEEPPQEEPPQEEPPQEEPPQEEPPQEEPPQEEPPQEEPPQEKIFVPPTEGGNYNGNAGGIGQGNWSGDGSGTGIGNGIGYVAVGAGTGIGSDPIENINIFAQYPLVNETEDVTQTETQESQTQQAETRQVAVQRTKKQKASTRKAQISNVHTEAEVQAAKSAAGGGGSRVKLYELEEEPEDVSEIEDKPFLTLLIVLAIVLLALGILSEGIRFNCQKKYEG